MNYTGNRGFLGLPDETGRFHPDETEKMIGQDLREPLAERISNFAGKHARVPVREERSASDVRHAVENL